MWPSFDCGCVLRVAPRACAIAIAPMVAFASAASHGATIYGTVTQDGAPLRQARIELLCGTSKDWRSTDDLGSYRLAVRSTGSCRLTVLDASAPVMVYEEPTRYDWVYQQQPRPALMPRR